MPDHKSDSVHSFTLQHSYVAWSSTLSRRSHYYFSKPNDTWSKTWVWIIHNVFKASPCSQFSTVPHWAKSPSSTCEEKNTISSCGAAAARLVQLFNWSLSTEVTLQQHDKLLQTDLPSRRHTGPHPHHTYLPSYKHGYKGINWDINVANILTTYSISKCIKRSVIYTTKIIFTQQTTPICSFNGILFSTVENVRQPEPRNVPVQSGQ